MIRLLVLAPLGLPFLLSSLMVGCTPEEQQTQTAPSPAATPMQSVPMTSVRDNINNAQQQQAEKREQSERQLEAP